MGLAFDVGGGGLVLRVQRVELLVEMADATATKPTKAIKK